MKATVGDLMDAATQRRFMLFPLEVPIGPYRYAVSTPDIIVNEDGAEMAGFASTTNEVIEVWSGMTARGRFEVLIHECLHAISDQIPVPHALSEDQIAAISPYITALMYELTKCEPWPLTELQEAQRQALLSAKAAARKQAAANDVPDTDEKPT
jgi:hypothetical protein